MAALHDDDASDNESAAVLDRRQLLRALQKMRSYEVCRQFRQRGLAGARIIAMTGCGQERDRHRAKSAGFDAYAVSPVEFAQLAKLMIEGLSERGSA